MTALHLITRLSLGGPSLNTIDSVVALDRAGWRTILAAGSVGAEISVVDQARSRGCRTVLLPALTREVSPARDLLALWQVFRLIRRERVVLVHTHTSKAGFVGRLAAWLAGVPVILHTPHGHIFYGYYGPALTAVFVGLERLAARITDRIVVLTELGTEEHLARGIGRPKQFVVIPSGVDLEALRRKAPPYETARGRLGVDSETCLIVGVGRLVPVKNGKRMTHEELTKAAYEVLTDDQKIKLERLHEVDLALSVAGLGRFRANVFHQRGSTPLRSSLSHGPMFAS